MPQAPAAPAARAAPPRKGNKVAEEILVCCICRVNPRAKKQVFCPTPCYADVKAAERDAMRRSGANRNNPDSDIQYFRKLKKQGGDGLRAAILTYKARCAGHGRGYTRPSFDWVRYSMAIELASRLQSGSKCLWLGHKALYHNVDTPALHHHRFSVVKLCAFLLAALHSDFMFSCFGCSDCDDMHMPYALNALCVRVVYLGQLGFQLRFQFVSMNNFSFACIAGHGRIMAA